MNRDKGGLSSPYSWMKVQASEVIQTQKTVVVDSEASVFEACLLLIKNEISSVPIYDKKSSTYLGLFDLHDLVRHINRSLSKSGTGSPRSGIMEATKYYSRRKISAFGRSGEGVNGMEENIRSSATGEQLIEPEEKIRRSSVTIDRERLMNKLKEHQAEEEKAGGMLARRKSRELQKLIDLGRSENEGFLETKVLDLSDESQQNPLYAVMAESTMAQIADVFGAGIHRVVVMGNNSENMEGILSQSAVIKYLYGNSNNKFAELGPILDTTLGDLQLAYKNVTAVRSGTPLTSALFLMDRQGISSLPIIDDQWRILGCISLSDVKYLVLPQFKHLIRVTCREFMQSIRYFQGLADGRDKMPVFCVYPDTKLRSVIAKLVATDSHRVWVTQPGNSVTKLGGSYTGGGNDIELRRSLSRGSAHSNANNPATNTSSSMGTGSGPLSLAGKAAGYESDGTSSDVSDTLSSGGSRHLAGGIVGMGSALVEGSVCGVVSLTDIMHVLSNRTQACNDSQSDNLAHMC